MENPSLPIQSPPAAAATASLLPSGPGADERLLALLSRMQRGDVVEGEVKAFVAGKSAEVLLRLIGGDIIFPARSDAPLAVGQALLLELIDVSPQGRVEFRLLPTADAGDAGAGAVRLRAEVDLLGGLGRTPTVENFETLKALLRFGLPATDANFEAVARLLSAALEHAAARGPDPAGTEARPTGGDPNAPRQKPRPPEGGADPDLARGAGRGVSGSLASASEAALASDPRLRALFSNLIESAVHFVARDLPPAAPLVVELADLLAGADETTDRLARLVDAVQQNDRQSQWRAADPAVGRDFDRFAGRPAPARVGPAEIQAPPALARVLELFQNARTAEAGGPAARAAPDSAGRTLGLDAAALATRLGELVRDAAARALASSPTLANLFAAEAALERSATSRPRGQNAPVANSPASESQTPATAEEAAERLKTLVRALRPGTPEAARALKEFADALPLDRLRQLRLLFAGLERDLIRDLPELAAPRRVHREAQDLLSRAALFKALSLAQAAGAGEERFTFVEVPVPLGDEARRVLLRIGARNRDPRRRGEPAGAAFTIALSLEMTRLGRVEGRVTRAGKRLEVTFVVRDDEVAKMFEEQIGALRQSLGALGFNAAVHVRRQETEEDGLRRFLFGDAVAAGPLRPPAFDARV
ncbi:MAG: flagellar hook-length control protein FliK [Planctomycetes bacterium]|nr:flagellar hook-length control protein FliK [Planctomycetota bacterium]